MATDPVCYAIVDEDTRFTSTYRERKFCFCSGFCKRKFEESPEKYFRLSFDLNIDPGGASC